MAKTTVTVTITGPRITFGVVHPTKDSQGVPAIVLKPGENVVDAKLFKEACARTPDGWLDALQASGHLLVGKKPKPVSLKSPSGDGSGGMPGGDGGGSSSDDGDK